MILHIEDLTSMEYNEVNAKVDAMWNFVNNALIHPSIITHLDYIC